MAKVANAAEQVVGLPSPLPVMSVSLFSITGFFAVENGNKQNHQHRTHYDTAISCVHPPAIPAEVYMYSPPGQPFLCNRTVVHLTGKVYYLLPVTRDLSSSRLSRCLLFLAIP
jgi:hypothetical protein